jgi:ABC-type Fe3+/spermidine/putrescine transport system ATPase subunit
MSGGSPTVLELRNVDIHYGRTPVVANASFDVAQGEFVTLLGPSGSGKTSLLRAIAGFVVPSAGEVRLHGARMENVPPFERDVGMVFQNYALFPHMTVAQNLSFGPRMLRIAKTEIERRVGDALARVRLAEYAARYPHELSGGQQQRVAIARALAIRPSLLLLDEPMSNLDARLRAQMRGDLIRLLKDLGVTALSVTHNQEEALAMSDRIIVMSQGEIRQIGSPTEIYLRPADPFVADFIGDANVVRARFAGASDRGLARFDAEDGTCILAALSSGDTSERCVLLVRPEAIKVGRDSGEATAGSPMNRMRGRVASCAYMGAFTEMRIAAAAQEFLVKRPAGPDVAGLAPGDEVVMEWDPAAVIALRADQPPS